MALRLDRVRQPGVTVVHPPDQGQEQDDLCRRGEVRAGSEDAGQLGDRKDEDEIEEQLESRNASASLRRLRPGLIIPISRPPRGGA
jgi:hypothetical protein